MSRQKFQDGMEVLFQDFNKLQARMQQEFYDRIIFELIQKTEDAFFGDSHKVNFASPTSVTVQPGIGFQTDSSVDAEEPQKRLLYRAASATLNITAPDTVNNRIDIVVAKWQLIDGATESRKFKDASSGVVSNENLVTSEEWETELLLVDGTAAGSPTEPAVPAGYIKIAVLNVAAVAGMANQADITDSRTLMPLGALATINSSAFLRLTQSPTLSMQQALTELDALAVNSNWLTNIVPDSVSDPAAPANNLERVIYNKAGQLFVRESGPEGGAVLPLGSGAGGGGGGANWVGDALEDTEFSETVWRFAQGDTQQLTLFVKVPQGYLPGRQIQAFLGFYSPSASDDFKMSTTTTLVRKGQDPIGSSTNQHTSDTGDIVNDQANEYREGALTLTSVSGQVNGFSVSPGDLLKVVLTRIAPAGTEDTEDIRFVPSATEVKFG